MELDTATRPTGFADRGRQIDNDVLRGIHSIFKGAIDGLAEDGRRSLEQYGVQAPDSVDVEFYVELPGRSAGELALALDAIDFAWRIAQVVADVEEAELPSSGGSTNLDDLVPVELYGLEVEAIEVGSIKSWLKGHGVTYDRTIATLSLVVAMSGPPSGTLFGQAEPAGQDTVTQVLLVRELDPEAEKIAQGQHAGLPSGSQTQAKITLPDGTTILANLPMSSIPQEP